MYTAWVENAFRWIPLCHNKLEQKNIYVCGRNATTWTRKPTIQMQLPFVINFNGKNRKAHKICRWFTDLDIKREMMNVLLFLCVFFGFKIQSSISVKWWCVLTMMSQIIEFTIRRLLIVSNLNYYVRAWSWRICWWRIIIAIIIKIIIMNAVAQANREQNWF